MTIFIAIAILALLCSLFVGFAFAWYGWVNIADVGLTLRGIATPKVIVRAITYVLVIATVLVCSAYNAREYAAFIFIGFAVGFHAAASTLESEIDETINAYIKHREETNPV